MTALRLPDFAIVGAQKSASTFVQDALRTHPDIFMPAGETRFFEDPEYGDGNLAGLAASFADCRQRRIGIKRPDYLGRPEVPARLRSAIPDLRVVVVLRHPIDRLVSAYYYYIKLGFLPVLDINEAIARLLRGEPIGNPKSRDLLDYGNYATHLQRYFSLFPREQIRVLLQEDVVAGEREAIAGICTFVGVDPARMGAMPPRANTGVYPLRRLRFLTRRNRHLYDYDAVTGKLKPHPMTIGRWLPAAAITAVDRLVLARMIGNRKPRLHESTQAMLAEYYRAQIEETAQLLGRDLGGWLR
ncbi:MAG: sulfotransferase domain-containing protein [Proteobacteria bacterium]|nr:sulfotransferase domain-containing protein [Pseudomonadota bacterium]